MSITRSYNKHTDTYYAYDTTYEWDEKLQKKVQRKKCIGKYDPVTGNIIPNGKRGRPAKKEPSQTAADNPAPDAGLDEALSMAEALLARIGTAEAALSKAAEETRELRKSADALARALRAEN